MAYERKTDSQIMRGDSLDAFVSNLSKTFSDQVAARNAQDEVAFNQAVVDNNLSLDDQLVYRQNQLKDVSDDPTERARVRGEISNLKERIEQKTFTDAYQQKLTDAAAGRASIDSVLQWLSDTKTATTDPTILDTINKEITTQTQNQFTMTKNMLVDQTNYALNDKTQAVLDAQIAKVNSSRATALLNGDTATAASLDLQVQALNKAKAENSVQKDISSLAVQTITGYSSATNLLDNYNAKIASAANTGSITVGGTTYDSVKQFWTNTRDSYVSDTSSSGLFARLNNEVATTFKTASSNNTLNAGTLQSTTSQVFDPLVGRPELAAYQTQLTQTKQSALQTGADLVSKDIQNTYAVNYDVNQAVASLSSLKQLGVNVSDAYSNILTAAGSVKQNQVNSILGSAQQLMANDPNISAEEAVNRAVAAGAGTVYSPQDLATTPESKIAKTGAATATQGTGKDNPATTVQPNIPAAPAPAPGAATSIDHTALSSIGNLAPGASGADVKTLQTYLIQNGYAIKDGATGFYGAETQAAVTALQKSLKVDTQGADGFFGPITKAAIAKTGTAAPAALATPAPAPTPVATPKPVVTPAAAPAAPAAPASPAANTGSNNSYANNADYLKVKSGSVGAAGDFGRTPGGIVQLSTGKILS